MKRRSFLPLLLAASSALPAFAQQPANKPKLVLLIVVDQLRYDYLTRFRSEYKSGLARMLDTGAVFTNGHFEHFPTVTAIGHSTVLTGATPAVSGIVGNEWYDRAAKKQVTSVSDPSVKTLGAPAREGASPHRLLVTTLSDELKAAGPSKSIGISMKDRSAILPVGRSADAAYWFDAKTGNFVSSTYYFNVLPAWAEEFNKSRAVDRFLGAEWKPISPAPTFSPATLFGKLPAEAGQKYYDAVVLSPFGNDLVVMFTERALSAEGLGKSGGVDVLSVSFSSNDAVGHKVGPDAPEVRDISIHTDRQIGRLLEAVEAEVGLANTVVVLTADHGVAPVPEVSLKRGLAAGRLRKDVIPQAVEAALSRKYGEGKWVESGSYGSLYLNHSLIEQKGLDLAEVQRATAAVVRKTPGVLRVYAGADLLAGSVPDDIISRRVAAGFFPNRGADIYTVLEPYWLHEGSGTSHGSPYSYDSHVPIVFMGPGIRAGRYHMPAAVNDIAPTLATMLEIETPNGSMGRVLEEMFAK
ncbi:MAG: alkaline phosphatase family protein [Bryobacteraceae bacterium]